MHKTHASRGWRRTRGLLTRGILAGFVLSNMSVSWTRSTDQVALRLDPAYRDPITQFDVDVRRALLHLPPSGTIGYLRQDFERSNIDDLAALFRAQYSLTPRLVTPSAGPDFVLAAPRADGILPDVPPGYELAQHFSTTLALYRRAK
jgi:hypothetical protein